MDKIKILVVDDESRMRKLVKDFLGREGYWKPATGWKQWKYFMMKKILH